MKLSDCLNTADIATLRKIADHYRFECSKHSKLELLQEILFQFRSKSFITRHIQDWFTGRERMMLRLCLDTRTIFSAEEFEGIRATSESDCTATDAMSEGWLFPTTQFSGRFMYCIPSEIHAQLRNFLVENVAKSVIVSSDGPLTFQEEGMAIVHDLDVMLEYVRHHDVRLTTDGSMYKRNLVQVLELLEVNEPIVSGGWRFGYGRRFHDYPDRLALIYDYAYHQKIVMEQEEGCLTLGPGCEEWMNLSPNDRVKSMVRFYVSLYRRPITRLPQILQLIAYSSTDWVQSQSMQRVVDALGLLTDYYYDNKENVWHSRILNMMMHLGLLRIGCDEEDNKWFQITALGQRLLTPDQITIAHDRDRERQRILIVQPNFEIVVTADQPVVTAQVALFTELKQAGAIRVYRITEDSIRKGMQNGGSPSSWLQLLQNHSQTPVPGNVERTMLEWDRSETVGQEGLSSS